jgi:hypothetical protein
MRRRRSDRRWNPRTIARVRIAVGIWLLLLAAIAWRSGYWWGVLLVAPAVLHFYLAHRREHHAIR